jgi:hypothetical protein
MVFAIEALVLVDHFDFLDRSSAESCGWERPPRHIVGDRATCGLPRTQAPRRAKVLAQMPHTVIYVL